MFFKPFEPPIAPNFPDRVFDIRDYGAKEGEKITDAISDAIEACFSSGGGRVLIPAGEWLSGPIHLKDNVNLHLEKGAVVNFSKSFNDYLPVVYGILAGVRAYSVSHFIYAYKCKNIAVTGEGVFNGNGEAWWHMKKHQPGMEDLMKKGKAGVPVSERVYDKAEYGVRPRMLQFVECENVLIEGVTFKNSPSWTVHPAWCKNITVRNVTVDNPLGSPNTDGINLESCRRGLIENCEVSVGDDLICLKAGRDEDAWEVGVPCEDIEIRNCRAKRGVGSITIGSETSASIRNAYIHDCTLGSHLRCIRIKTMKGRGGVVENIDYENITIENAESEAISITMKYAGEPLDDQSKPNANMPKLRNISIKNVVCKNAKRQFEIVGVSGYEIENLYLENINVSASVPPLIENVKNLNFKNVNMAQKTGD